jgi:glycosyltransferase involved in cell wall biosynthesis
VKRLNIGRHSGRRVPRGLLDALGWWLQLATVYLDMLALVGCRRASPHTACPDAARHVQITALVPAHDEESVVAGAVTSLLAQADGAYDLEVVVIADNCTDETAATAEAAGAEVWARTDVERRGKGHALNWALDRLATRSTPPEWVLFMDSDCTASSALVTQIARLSTDRSLEVVQFAYRVANGDASELAALRAAGFALRNELRPRALQRLGISCGLYGSGMAFRWEVIGTRRWPESITEDTEMHLALNRDGIRVHFNGDAAVESAMPVTVAAAADQQSRWEGGNLSLLCFHAGPVLRHAARTRNLDELNSAVALAVPPQSLLFLGSLGLGGLSLIMRDRNGARRAVRIAVGQAFYVIVGLRSVAAEPLPWRSLLGVLPGFLASRIEVFARLGRRGAPVEWVRTARDGQAPAASENSARRSRADSSTS